MKTKLLFIIILLSAFSTHYLFAQIPAFPGAEGWGAVSIGGRGGNVIQVTNLNDAGPGSFREACSTPGARTIVFRTGGVIVLLSEVQITDPFIYIAGQTAPGDGIVLKNFPITIFTHDVTIRGMRIRAGSDLPNLMPDNRDCITVESGSYNVIIDHCSFSWGSDENVSILDSGVHAVTVQWCIISEGLFASMHPKGFHSMGILIAYDATQTSTHHNLLAHNAGRNPLIARRTDHEFVNNIVYDWKYSCDLLEQGTQFKLDFAGNYYKPLTYSSAPELPLQIDFDSSTVFGTKLYVPNNYFSPNIPFITPAQLNAMGAGNAALFSATSLLSVPSSVTLQSPFAAYNSVLACAGALHPKRDTTDKRVLQSVIDSTGGLIDCIGTSPILLDSGNVKGSTDSTIIYSTLGKPFHYSAASRKIVIASGTGAGQVRYGLDGTPTVLDTAKMIFECKINPLWTTKPDSTSTYKFFAGCNNVLAAYPAYAAGTPPADADQDGMPDTWEISNGLDPNNASDHNGTNLSSTGYTNLEVYLNGLYPACNPITSSEDLFMMNTRILVYPNPFSFSTTIRTLGETLQNTTLTVYNIYGQAVKEIAGLPGSPAQSVTFQRGTLPGGLYFIRLEEGNKTIATEKLLISNY